ncbi:MAG: M20/M25/M40 family metallo-hydrolase [Acutalibacteraceae bacterium]|nr:M20/M25/M40 family metallo-hydrolase [Acutalibacteraceae bacterium]
MWWKILLGVLAVIVLVTLIKAMLLKPKKIEKVKVRDVNIDEKKVAEHLSDAIKFKTISKVRDEGVDWEEFEKFHEYLDKTYPLVAKNTTKEIIDKASLLYLWKGKNPDLEPMAMLAHQDVVPVSEGTEKDWKYEAFSGHIDGEYVWGRGALDMKNHLICVMEAVETLMAEGFQPERDVYLCFGHNEETVSTVYSGAGTIVKTLKERGVHLDSVLDEGSALIKLKVPGIIDTHLAAVGTAEKGYVDMKITLHDKGGHTSAAPKHSGMWKLANAVRDLEKHQFRSHWLPFLDDLVKAVGGRSTFLGKLIICNYNFFKPILKAILISIPQGASLARTITSVSMCEGSPAANVLPQRPSITVNFRPLPGDSLADVEAHVRKKIRYKDIDIEYFNGKEATPFSPTDSRAFKAIESVENSIHPEGVAVAPYLVMSGTDAYRYGEICENILRFAPFNVPLSLFFTTHATNERIPIDSLAEAVVFFREYIIKVSDKD